MLICRYQGPAGPQFGVVEQGVVYSLLGDPFTDAIIGGRVSPLSEVSLLPPITPSKIVCVGRNYLDHVRELGNQAPAEPLLFLKPPSALIGMDAPIELLPEMRRVDHEAELAVIVKRRGRFIPTGQALEYVLGYCCANDISEREYQKQDGQWTRAKGFDTFCPLGPWINTSLDASDLGVTCRVNGQERQRGRTSDMIFAVPALVSYISGIMTLEAGDVILTGTPSGVGAIHAGDVLEVEIEGVGVLRNPVVAYR